MSNCLRQSFSFSKKLFTCNINSSSKSFSSLSSLHHKYNSNCGTKILLLKKTIKSKQIQHRYISLDNPASFFEYLRKSEATKLFTNAIIGAHDFTGASWSVTIFAAAAIMKLIVSLPCGIYQQYLLAILELTRIELKTAVKELRKTLEKKALLSHWTNTKFQYELQKEVKQVWKTLIVKNNCHPFKITILFFLQLPFWLILTMSIRSLAKDASSKNVSQMEHPVTALQFKVGGPFWCKNLSVPDRTLILPTINTLSLLTINELAQASRVSANITQNFQGFLVNKIIPNFLRVFAVVFFFISASSPSGVSLFWVSSSLISLGQNLLLLSPRMRRFLRIPKTAAEQDKPYSYALNNFIQNWMKPFNRKK